MAVKLCSATVILGLLHIHCPLESLDFLQRQLSNLNMGMSMLSKIQHLTIGPHSVHELEGFGVGVMGSGSEIQRRPTLTAVKLMKLIIFPSFLNSAQPWYTVNKVFSYNMMLLFAQNLPLSISLTN